MSRGVIFPLAAVLLLATAVFSWAQTTQSLGSITLTEVSPRILTPNGDNLNDVAFFKFDTVLTGIPLSTAIFDITGAKIASLVLDATETSLTWDGKDQSGKVVPAGIYIYQISVGQKIATGTVVVAR